MFLSTLTPVLPINAIIFVTQILSDEIQGLSQMFSFPPCQWIAQDVELLFTGFTHSPTLNLSEAFSRPKKGAMLYKNPQNKTKRTAVYS